MNNEKENNQYINQLSGVVEWIKVQLNQLNEAER